MSLMRVLGGRLVLALALSFTALSVADQAAGRTETLQPGPKQAADLDPANRESMRTGWTEILRPAIRTPVGWTGDLTRCKPGAPSPASQEATLTAVNYVRDVSGLEPVTFSDDLSRRAQKAALILAANHDLSESPPDDWACTTNAGRNALGRSDLFVGRAGAGAVVAYMNDAGDSRTAAAERRWLLDPRQTTMGSGSVDAPGTDWREVSNALFVTDAASWQEVPDDTPQFLPWPVAGFFPLQIEPHGRWSLSIPYADVDFSDAVVTVNGSSAGIVVHAVETGYGPPTVVWDFDPDFHAKDPDRDYDVTVSGMTRAGEAMSPYSYTVTLFDANVAPATNQPPTLSRSGPAFDVRLGDFDTAWDATDDDGVQRIQVRHRTRTPGTRFGPWTTGAWTSGAASSSSWTAQQGQTTCESARAEDTQGNVSAWVAPATCRQVPVDDAALTRSAGWSTTSDERLWNGSASTTRQQGAVLSLPGVVRASRLGVVATTCSGCGTVRVMVGSHVFNTIRLDSSAVSRQKVLMLPELVTARSGTVKLVVRSSGKKVQIDGLVVG